MNFGALAGSIGKALQEDNKRVALRTERAMDFLTKELLDEKKEHKNKVESVEEAIERLSSNGYDKPLAASIARGGVYAVQDAVTRAAEARKLGQNANDWYATTAEYNPEQFADMTSAQLANAVVDPVDLSFSRFEDIEGIDQETYREYMQEYGLAQPQETISTRVSVPDFKFDSDDAMTLNIKDAYSAALSQRFMLEQKIAEGGLDETALMQAQTKVDALNTKIDSLRDYGIRSGVISDPGFTGSETRVNFNLRLEGELNNMSAGGDFGAGAIFSTSESGVLISKYEPEYTEKVQAASARTAADFIDGLQKDNMFGVDAEATMTAMGYQIFDITEDIVNSSPALNEDDIGKQAVNYNGHVAIIGD